MTHLFYFIAIFYIWHEINWIIDPVQKVKESKRFFELHKANKGLKKEDWSSEYKEEMKDKIFPVFLILWMFIGLFTFQWDVFLFMILLNLLIIAPLSKLTKFNIIYTIIHWINSVIGVAFGLFVIINHYHLKISLYPIVKDWFN